MRIIRATSITQALVPALKTCLCSVETAACTLLKQAAQASQNGAEVWALDCILKNNDIARQTCSPACQDTGLCVFFVEIGDDLHIEGNLPDAVNAAVAKAYTEAYFRKSVVADPLSRVNTGDNTPAVLHCEYTKGDALRIRFLAKGAGSENMSALYMLTPSKGRAGVIASVVDCVKKAGANPCPPIIVGVGIGGDTELACLLAKKSLARSTGEPSPNPANAALERDILDAVNKLGIGVQGFGGSLTALAAAVESAPTHIGMLPVAVNIQCHSVRHFELVL